MVFYAPKRQSRRATDGTITDLPDELLLCILDYLEPLDSLNLRLTCVAFTPAANTAVTQRTKRLYISPMRSSLLAAVEICAHPSFSFTIEEVVILGSSPQRDEWLSRGRPIRKEYGEWFKTWPTTFPASRNAVASEDAGSASRSFQDAYKPLLDALSTLPRLKRLLFANKVSCSTPGFNQIKQSSLDSFPKRHLGKPSARHKRWSDGYAMFSILAALGSQIQEVAFPHLFADVYEDLITAELEFALELQEPTVSLEVSRNEAVEETMIRARLGGYVVSNGSSLVSRGKFAVMEGSFIAELRCRRVSDALSSLRYIRYNGEWAQVKLMGCRLNVG